MTAYISSTGQIQRGGGRGGPAAVRRVSIARLFLVAVAVSILCATNPANRRRRHPAARTNVGGGRKLLGSYGISFLGIELDLFRTSSPPPPPSSSTTTAAPSVEKTFGSSPLGSKETNFALFTLEKRLGDGVWVGIMMHNFQICRFDQFYATETTEGFACSWIAEHLCHGLDGFGNGNRAFAANRILALLLGTSFLLSLCSVPPGDTNDLTIPIRMPLASVDNLFRRPLLVPLSVFSSPSILFDLCSLHVTVYPALVLMNRVVSRGRADGDATWHFVIGVALLVGGAGGLANVASSLVTGRGACGFQGVASACLGYQVATSMSPRDSTSLRILGVELLGGEILVAVVTLHVFRGRKGLASLLSWIVGGMAGTALGTYQR